MPDKKLPLPPNTVSPYLVAKDAPKLLEFMKTVFGAEERMMLHGPDKMIMHGEVTIGDSVIMLAEACEQSGPKTAMLCIYVPDVDAAYQQALDAGATSEREPADQFYGDRSAGVIDPFGNQWYMATPVEDVSPEEMERRHQEMMAGDKDS